MIGKHNNWTSNSTDLYGVPGLNRIESKCEVIKIQNEDGHWLDENEVWSYTEDHQTEKNNLIQNDTNCVHTNCLVKIMLWIYFTFAKYCHLCQWYCIQISVPASSSSSASPFSLSTMISWSLSFSTSSLSLFISDFVSSCFAALKISSFSLSIFLSVHHHMAPSLSG